MRLGALIEALEAVPGTLPIEYADGRKVAGFASYLGYYNNLTLMPEGEFERTQLVTVADVLDAARAARGATFTGYKGGDFTMDVQTPVWADGYGDASGTGISGVDVHDGKAVIGTFDASDYGGW